MKPIPFIAILGLFLLTVPAALTWLAGWIAGALVQTIIDGFKTGLYHAGDRRISGEDK